MSKLLCFPLQFVHEKLTSPLGLGVFKLNFLHASAINLSFHTHIHSKI